MTIINNIFELAVAVGTPEDRVSLIGRAVYKYTECGCVFNETATGVTVCGYAEGADAECVPIALDYPFTLEEWESALDQADEDGCDLWNEWNAFYGEDSEDE